MQLMSDDKMTDQSALERLRGWDTPTICNALEVLRPELRGFGYSTSPFSCLYPDMPPIVGFARTACIRAASPAVASESGGLTKLAYYDYMHEGPRPAIVVIEDLDAQPGTGAYWGEVNTAIHKALGTQGVITNGSYRDIRECADDFQILGGMVGPSHAFVHPVSVGGTVRMHGLRISEGDLLHADRHGVAIVPIDLVDEIPAAVATMVAREDRILSIVRAATFDHDAFRRLMDDRGEVH